MDPLIAYLQSVMRNEIRIFYKEPEKAPSLWKKLTAFHADSDVISKIGGKPSVPADFVWPEYEDKEDDGEVERLPLSFLAQINLRELAEYDEEGLLPKEGVLSFFYELDTMRWGFSQEDKGCARVYYFEDESKLVSMQFPEGLEEDNRIPEIKISFEKHISLPDEESLPDELEPEDPGDYQDAREEMGYDYPEEGRTKLLGYPDVIQDSMEEQCERLLRGYEAGSPEDYQKISEEEAADIKEKAKEWMLLFQMSSIETDDYELMYEDCGSIYFWIRKSDLKEKKFDNCWLILQCY